MFTVGPNGVGVGVGVRVGVGVKLVPKLGLGEHVGVIEYGGDGLGVGILPSINVMDMGIPIDR